MMVIKDLAERWGVSVPQAKTMVRDMKVPFVALRNFDMKIDWRFIRFKPDVVESWERSRENVFPDRPCPAPRFVTGRKLRRS
jgi:hypothetical protein